MCKWYEPEKAPSPQQRKTLGKKMKQFGSEVIYAAAPPVAVMSKEIGCNKAESLSKSGDYQLGETHFGYSRLFRQRECVEEA